MLPDSYTAVHRYDGAMLQRDQRDQISDCCISDRDIAIVHDVWRYRFLTSDQIGALHWPGKTPQAVRRRLAKLFAAALLERFRPYSRRGSYAWTYHVGVAGHRVLRESGHIEPRARYQPRRLVDYSYVIHDLQLNAWILTYRQHLQYALIDWHGETPIHPAPKAQRGQLAAADPWTVEGLGDPVARPVFPDAVLEIKRPQGPTPWTVLLEHDRTRRVDKNYDKFRRYDRFLTSWHHQSGFARPGGDEPAPYVLFICQDQDQRQLFMQAADHELGGYRCHPSTPSERDYRGRRRILFAVELDIHQGVLDAARLPVLPPGHLNRTDENSRVRRVRLPGPLVAPPPPAGSRSDAAAPLAESVTAESAPGRGA